MHRLCLLLGSTLLLSFVAGCASGPGFEETETAVLEKSDRGELLALDPVPKGDDASKTTTTGEDFHGYRVLGRAQLDKDERERLIGAARGAVDDNEGRAMKCFNPRHGLRVVAQGDTVDLVICFECLQMKVYQGAQERLLLIGQEQEREFDEAFSRHSLQKAP